MRPAAVLRAGGVLACLQRAEKGEWHGGPRPPYGYRLLPAGGKRTLAVVPEAAALLHEAAGRVLAGQSLYAIRQDWNRRGLTSGAGKPWRSQGIKRCLVRAAVAGLTERRGEVFPGPGRRSWTSTRGSSCGRSCWTPSATRGPSSSAAPGTP